MAIRSRLREHGVHDDVDGSGPTRLAECQPASVGGDDRARQVSEVECAGLGQSDQAQDALRRRTETDPFESAGEPGETGSRPLGESTAAASSLRWRVIPGTSR